MYYVCDKCDRERPNTISDPTCIKGGYCHWIWKGPAELKGVGRYGKNVSLETKADLGRQALSIQTVVNECHNRSADAGWYNDPVTARPIKRNIPEMLCLIHSEISEALEGYRMNLNDNKLPHRKSIEVELADALIRIADLAGYLGLDLGGAYVEKLLYNERIVP